MNKFYLLTIFLFCVAVSVHAQNVLKGTVYEHGTNTRLENVFIRDNNTKQYALADKQGDFEIKTEPGHLLIFDSPGYVSDSLYVVDVTPKRIDLIAKTIALREVSISSTRQYFDPHKEYADVYTKSKVYVFSPSSWFSKEGKDARRLKKYFELEEQERRIDAVFTRTYVSSIVPLKGQELENFMTLYRPTYAFVTNNNGPSLAVYINDSYKKYLALPPDKRALPKLSDQ